MSTIQIHEPELRRRRGFNGFYGHFLSALVEHAGARDTTEPRPLPRVIRPREHESCWVRWGTHWVFFDMSDHVQLFDLEALKLCSVYFKANLHRGIAGRILDEAGLSEQSPKLAPFLFFSEGLGDFIRDANRRRFWRMDRPRYDVCFVMGVYANPVRDGGRSPFEHPDEPMTPAAYHFWIRWHIQQALREAGIPGYYRLTSRANRALEDGQNVYGNLSRRAFSRWITDGRITAVCTFPHALFPWKASESFVLGRPLLIEQTPLTETPTPFMPVAGEHYLELLPDTGGFDPKASLDDPASYRVLARIASAHIRERAEWLRDVLADRERLSAMGEACQVFAARAYHKKHVADYICAEVEKRIR
ncbi:MAG TPA: hypothetical protein PKY11_00490 [Kiritimatiellia bacterium]|nr:hypothetical protein [Kiritimatiellia bacterium]